MNFELGESCILNLSLMIKSEQVNIKMDLLWRMAKTPWFGILLAKNCIFLWQTQLLAYKIWSKQGADEVLSSKTNYIFFNWIAWKLKLNFGEIMQMANRPQSLKNGILVCLSSKRIYGMSLFGFNFIESLSIIGLW